MFIIASFRSEPFDNAMILKVFTLTLWQPMKLKCTKRSLEINICEFISHGSPAPRKYFNNRHFPSCGTIAANGWIIFSTFLFSPRTASVFGDVLLAIPPMMRKTASRKSAVQSNKKRAAFIYQFLVNDLTARYRWTLSHPTLPSLDFSATTATCFTRFPCHSLFLLTNDSGDDDDMIYLMDSSVELHVASLLTNTVYHD